MLDVGRVKECLLKCSWDRADPVVREFLAEAERYICGELRRLGYMCYRDIVESAGEGRAEAEFEAILDRIYSLPRFYGIAVLRVLNATRVIFECLRDYHKRTRDYKLYALDRAVYAVEHGLEVMKQGWLYQPKKYRTGWLKRNIEEKLIEDLRKSI